MALVGGGLVALAAWRPRLWTLALGTLATVVAQIVILMPISMLATSSDRSRAENDIVLTLVGALVLIVSLVTLVAARARASQTFWGRALIWGMITTATASTTLLVSGAFASADVEAGLLVPAAAFAMSAALTVLLHQTLGLVHGRAVSKPVSSGINQSPVDVFVSYKREERRRVEELARALRGIGLNVWLDSRLQAGNSFDAEINRQVRSAKCVLVCWSRASVESEWVRAEASIGRERGVLVACFFEPCQPYPPFNLVHTEDLSSGRFDASNESWSRVLNRISELVHEDNKSR